VVLQNTLFITTQGAYARLDHETVAVESEGKVMIRVPFHHLGAIVAYGNVLFSPFLIHRCASDGPSITWMSEYGGFRAQVQGPTTGNVLLRVAQQEALREHPSAIVQRLVWGKVQNQRQILMRAARDARKPADKEALSRGAKMIAVLIKTIPNMEEVNRLRGVEGMAARIYFRRFPLLLLRDRDEWAMHGRNRRPPKDPVNALLSFGYALLRSECQSACEATGLDPQVGYLHALRPGRPAMALDLMEEFRSHFVDRMVVSLVNRAQLKPSDFSWKTGGAVELKDSGRRTFLGEYQKRKQETIRHEGIDQTVSLGLLPIIQARIMARFLRKDIDAYQPFLFR